jgi:hypothetical protein
MYVWPLIWVFGLMFVLSVPRFEQLRGAAPSSQPIPRFEP